MNIVQEDIDALNALLKVKIKKEDYEPKVKHSLNDYRKKINLKGFRKGMVPIGIVKKMYGNQVLVEEINKILSEEIDSYIREKELEVLGFPIPKEDEKLSIDITKLDDYEFNYELGLAPDVDLSYLEKKPKFTMNKVKIDKKMIDEEVGRLRKKAGNSVVATDNIREDDILHFELTELGDDGLPKEEGLISSSSLPVDMITDKKVKKAVKAAKKDEVIPVSDIFKLTDKSDSELSRYILNTEEENLGALNKKFNLKIINVNRIEPSEINQEFFDKVYKPGEVTTLEQLEEKIKNDLEQHFERESERKMLNDIVESMMEKIKIPLPENFLKKWIKASNEKPITDHDLENDFPAFSKNLKWSLIMKKIAKENEVKINPDEVKDRIRQMTVQQMIQYGLYEIDPQQLEEYVQQLLKDRDQVTKVQDSLMEEKVLDVVKGMVKISEKNVSLEQFNKSLTK